MNALQICNVENACHEQNAFIILYLFCKDGSRIFIRSG